MRSLLVLCGMLIFSCDRGSGQKKIHHDSQEQAPMPRPSNDQDNTVKYPESADAPKHDQKKPGGDRPLPKDPEHDQPLPDKPEVSESAPVVWVQPNKDFVTRPQMNFLGLGMDGVRVRHVEQIDQESLNVVYSTTNREYTSQVVRYEVATGAIKRQSPRISGGRYFLSLAELGQYLFVNDYQGLQVVDQQLLTSRLVYNMYEPLDQCDKNPWNAPACVLWFPLTKIFSIPIGHRTNREEHLVFPPFQRPYFDTNIGATGQTGIAVEESVHSSTLSFRLQNSGSVAVEKKVLAQKAWGQAVDDARFAIMGVPGCTDKNTCDVQFFAQTESPSENTRYGRIVFWRPTEQDPWRQAHFLAQKDGWSSILLSFRNGWSGVYTAPSWEGLQDDTGMRGDISARLGNKWLAFTHEGLNVCNLETEECETVFTDKFLGENVTKSLSAQLDGSVRVDYRTSLGYKAYLVNSEGQFIYQTPYTTDPAISLRTVAEGQKIVYVARQDQGVSIRIKERESGDRGIVNLVSGSQDLPHDWQEATLNQPAKVLVRDDQVFVALAANGRIGMWKMNALDRSRQWWQWSLSEEVTPNHLALFYDDRYSQGYVAIGHSLVALPK